MPNATNVPNTVVKFVIVMPDGMKTTMRIETKESEPEPEMIETVGQAMRVELQNMQQAIQLPLRSHKMDDGLL